MKRLTSFFPGVIWATIAGLSLQSAAMANDSSVLCENLDLVTEVAIRTREYDAAFCSTGYYDEEPGCYGPTAYYYIGQSRSSGDSIFLENATWTRENDVATYKVTNGDYTYQIQTSGAYAMNPWRSLSVLKNGRTIYYGDVDGYFGYWDC
ncbi:MAG: hypothetical protein HC796_10425 [Synechococcaceae cyanobacterium RL_1_2]|nr:hypothetical protein [Synechococcaceae cyanobacterium RL_1_2]